MSRLLDDDALAPLVESASRSRVAAALRNAIAAVRAGVRPDPGSPSAWAALVAEFADRAAQPSLRRAINATGIVLHTNLGRAPLASEAIAAVSAVAGGYTNLEYDLESGARGSRTSHARSRLCELTGAQDALVVNNGAAALVLALRALAYGRDVLVSRGELIEIGGSFRIPDIIAQADVRLVEVGTTNRTHLGDYRRPISPDTCAILKVHRSNFTMDGFVAEASVGDLASVAGEAGVPLVFDFGSGLLVDLERWGLRGEPTARDAVAAGASVVVMSGDKLLGGPQAGILVGSAGAISAMRAHPLARAMRVDKLTLAALEATLDLYRDAASVHRTVPVLAMITASRDEVRARAASLIERARARGVDATVVDSDAAVGGGAFPTATIPSAAIELPGDAQRWEASLRGARVPVIARIRNERCLLDVRTVLPADEPALLDALGAAP